MISHFWNLCRACPAVEVDKLHSEYKSTYRWHEFSNKAQDVVKKAPQSSGNNLDDSLSFSRKKKHPELAYKSHEFFDASLAEGSSFSRAGGGDFVDGGGGGGGGHASRRSDRGRLDVQQRRARSEGPVNRVKSSGRAGAGGSKSRLRDDELRPSVPSAARSALSVVSAGAGGNGRSQSQRRAGRGSRRELAKDEDLDPPMTVSFPPPAPSAAWNSQEDNGQAYMKESMSMGQIPAEQGKGNPGAAAAAAAGAAAGASRGGLSGSSEPRLNGVGVGSVGDIKMSSSSEAGASAAAATTPRRSRLYRSEYRVRYRPFSTYEYVDGRFIPSPSAAAAAGHSPPNEETAPTSSKSASRPTLTKGSSLGGEPWYKEVVELRKQANDYRCRGWGTDLAPPHLSELYQKQLDLYEQTKRRESLSALSLAITTPRNRDADTSSAASTTTTAPSSSAPAPRSSRPSRPGTAPPPSAAATAATRGSAKSSRSESAHPASDRHAHHPPQTHRNRKPANRSVSTSRTPRPRSPTKKPSQASSRPPSASTASSSVAAPSPAAAAAASADTTDSPGGGGWKVHKDPQQQQQQQPSKPAPVHDSGKRQRPNADGVRRGAEAGAGAGGAPQGGSSEPSTARRPFSRSSSSARGGGPSRDTSRPPSAIENHLDYFREPVVKSPPEPTRVKSPEGAVRSPDPINWTVPLDTGKTFSVTQSVRDGDSARNSPMSDHSSHFDSVSGTAINLGRNSRNDLRSTAGSSVAGGPPSHASAKISSLAKEARDYQPGPTKDSTMTKPAISSSAAAAAAAAEAAAAAASAEEESQKRREADDVMTRAIYQPAGSSLPHQSNGASSSSSANDVDDASSQNNNGRSVAGAVIEEDAADEEPIKSVPGTSLKCLEDPSFCFESSSPQKQKPVPAAAPAPKPPVVARRPDLPAQARKQPAYRVLEDPLLEADMARARPPPPPTRVADPMTAGIYDPSTSSDATTSANRSPNLGRPVATEVLEGARETFDKFWSKPTAAKDLES